MESRRGLRVKDYFEIYRDAFPAEHTAAQVDGIVSLLIRPDGTRTEYTTSLRMRSLHRLLALMPRAGLEPLAWYGGLDGSTLDLGSRRLVLISTRRP